MYDDIATEVVIDDFALSPDVKEMGASISYVNEAGVSEVVAAEAVRHGDVANAIENWMRRLNRDAQPSKFHTGDIFNRTNYIGSDNIFEVMAACAAAVEYDDVLSTLADTLEGLSFQKMHIEMHDDDQEDIWNQIAADLNMDGRLKEIWRELFKVSQVCVGILWEQKTYTVRTKAMDKEDLDALVPSEESEGEGGKGEGGKDKKKNPGNRNRKKKVAVAVPTALTIFDPTKIVPVGQLMFNRERLAYIADRNEHFSFTQVLGGNLADDMVQRLVERRYEPTLDEEAKLSSAGVPTDRLWLLKEDAAFRHTLTKAQYERWAIPRLKSVLEVLDLKRHLRQSDRAHLVGSTNFIVLIKKGSDQHPAKQKEIDNLQRQARVVARMPILVGDHRLAVEIVTPGTDNTLSEDRYNLVDARLVFRALQSFAPNVIKSASQGSGAVTELSRVVALGIESRRHQLARTFERELFRRTMELNPGVLDEVAKLRFTPKRVALDFNSVIAQSVLKLRDRGDISRESTLDEFDFDQDLEALRRLEEHRSYDKVFQSQVPHGSPQDNPFNDGTRGRPPGTQEEEPRKKDEAAALAEAVVREDYGEEIE